MVFDYLIILSGYDLGTIVQIKPKDLSLKGLQLTIKSSGPATQPPPPKLNSLWIWIIPERHKMTIRNRK